MYKEGAKALIQGQKRLSIRAIALRYGIPSRVVARAVWLGQLHAINTITETGRERVYIHIDDADAWFNSLPVTNKTASISGSK